ncbi:hypothetical protein KU6B_19730 [Mameliella alba]|uniref:hypothetical protein n=1 Tax=Mameliella alba TaxID=561184 RepID=UPI0013E47E40|nr:hypothetical protein KU6B_19730 [Mameliella alba]
MFATRRLTLAVLAACSLALPLSAQELPLGPRSDFGKVVLTNKQVPGARVQAVNFVAGYVENGVSENTRIYSVNPAPVEISPAAAPDTAVTLRISLQGFTRTMTRVSTLN